MIWPQKQIHDLCLGTLLHTTRALGKHPRHYCSKTLLYTVKDVSSFFNFPYVLLSSQIIKISHRDSLKPQFTDGFSDNDLYAQNEVLQGQQFVALIFQFSK